MAYLPIDNPNINEDLLYRKEFYTLKKTKTESIFDKDENLIPRFALDKYIDEGEFLKLQSYQIFIRNLINPHTPYSRLLVKHQTGTGKTIGSLSIAMEFIKQFRLQKETGDEDIGYVFIIGFTENTFKNELLRFPEFGFISRSEIHKWEKLKQNASNGSKIELDRLTEFQIMIKKRFSSRKGNGYFKFYGYKQLINRLFIITNEDLILSDMSHDEIRKAIEDKEIIYNMEVLEQFRNSLIICDEIHNTYNSLLLNNWGLGLQIIIDYHPSIRVVFMSATPINNSPTEIVDLLNLLIPVDCTPYKRKIIKSDIFDESYATEHKLKEKSLKLIATLVQGRISFLRDVNPDYFPSRCILGETIKGIDYIKFIRSPMSIFHYNTYKNNFTGTLSQDAQYLVDFALPDPTIPINKTLTSDGLFKTTETKRKLSYSSREWKVKFPIEFINNIITGDLLHKSTLGTYSMKYKTMVEDIQTMLKNKCGKIFIFHNIVHMSGVLFIQEVLLKNGIITDVGSPTDDTLCAICGIEKKYHKSIDNVPYIGSKEYTSYLVYKGGKTITDHIYQPARMIVVHADIDRSAIARNIEKFNLTNNADGHKFMIFIGSRVIKEAHTIKCVQTTMIMGRPDNIATLIQILGRTVRKYSHKDLPLHRRHVNIYIYTSCLPIKIKSSNKSPSEYAKSYEETRYGNKIQDYKIIQSIEKILHENAVDAIINRNIITLKGESQDKDVINCVKKNLDKKCSYDLDILDFEPALFKTIGKVQACKNFTLDELTLSTFSVYHNTTEVDTIVLIIKRLFTEISPVWEYNTLWKYIQNYSSFYEINTKLFDQANFTIALHRLVWTESSDYIEPHLISDDDNEEIISQEILYSKQRLEQMIDRMYDPLYKKILMPNMQEAVIKQLDRYYILFPISNTGEPIVDVEIPYRGFKSLKPINISIKKYLSTFTGDFNYASQKQRFYEKYKSISISDMKNAICECGNDFHICLVEECITCVFISWVFPYKKKNPMHDFYFKMLYYYDMMGSIIWANATKEYILNLYSKYIYKSTTETVIKKTAEDKGRAAILNLLQTSIDRSSCIDCSSGAIERYESSVAENIKIMNKYIKKIPKKKGKKDKIKYEEIIVPAPSNKLAIGHFFKYIPRFWHPIRQWFDSPEYLESKIEWKENNIIIGYEERSTMRTKFKIRSPIHKIKKFKDVRMIEKGANCISKNKKYLIGLTKELDIHIPEQINVNELCNKIHTELLKRELQERKNKSKIKYFYFYFEIQPLVKK